MTARGPDTSNVAVGGGSVTEARRVAAELCADLRRGELLDPAFEIRSVVLDARDRRWTQELIYGMLRRRSWIDAVLAARVRGGLARLDPDVIDLLRLGVYQLLFMGSVPAYAAIAQTVELTKGRHGLGASKLANAVLRRVDREQGALDVPTPTDPVDALALGYSHPRWLVARWIGRWGAADTELLLQANNSEAPVVLRPYGTSHEQLEATLESAGVRVEDVPLVRDSIQLGGGVSLTELGAFRQGLFFVQDPASTLVSRYAAIPPGQTVADLCAAPGGKALELSRDGNTIVAGDRSYVRTQRMRAGLRRVDARSVHPVVADARHPAVRPVDAVLLDVPCTGTGTFRRRPDARWRLKVSDLAVMAALQRSILRAAAAVVKPGGLLVYGTCSLEPEENDAQVESFLAESPEWRLEPPAEGVVPGSVLDAGRLRVLPQRHGVDGAFAARMKRAAG
ncbi:MAG: 16S rRNA (cytosine(967)-C(5))-methyltransferase RsmB [Gemmatimonadaceae bacterium]